MGRGGRASIIGLALVGTGCLATKPYVRTELQKSDARTQEQRETVDRRLTSAERDLGVDKARRGALEGDVHQIRVAVGETTKQVDATRGLAVKAVAKAAPAPATHPPVARTAETLLVYFGFAEWQLDNPARLTLLEAVKRLRNDPALIVKLEGHADNIGSPSRNLELSQRRADEVRRFLLESGIKRSRIEARAAGEVRPIASNRSPAGRDQNRRVSITLAPPTE
jgi:outer membrane protein OmpA-like peptidoglycan-associated protein